MARTIHGSGPRAARPFIEVNCTALPANLMEAELFGHERGAFTDAKESKMGLFEAAEGGFLFLDEVGDLELSLQGKLLRAIEERTVRRVGGIRDRKIDVRILAATNRDLEREAQREPFPQRPVLPPGGDPPAPAAAAGAGRRRPAPGGALPPAGSAPSTARRCAGSTPRARDLLLSYPWPGNVRELSHVIERAVLWSRGTTLDVEHLSLTTPGPATDDRRAARRAAPAVDRRARRDRGSHSAALPPPGMDLERWERAMIEQAMRECRRQPDPGGPAAGHQPGYAALPAEEVRDSGMGDPIG